MTLDPNSDPNRDQGADLPVKLREAMQLISALCEDSITPQQFEELQFQVCNDREICKFYVRMMHLHAGLFYFASALPDMIDSSVALDEESEPIPSGESVQSGMFETMVLPAMRASVDLEADSSERFAPAPLRPPAAGPQSPLRSWLAKGGIAALIFLLLGLVAIFITLMQKRQAPVAVAPKVQRPDSAPVPPSIAVHLVATFQYSSNPEWESPPAHDGGFAVDDSLKLRRGALQLNFPNGGRLVVEGPADLHFSSDTELRLNAGRIVADYPGGGLVVQCPTGSVKDPRNRIWCRG